MMSQGHLRKAITPGAEVAIVLKQDQRTGKLTRGIVKDILTKSPQHPHGIKVRLQDGQVGRVKSILASPATVPAPARPASSPVATPASQEPANPGQAE
uniref:YwbE family protein n=1 Tax=Paenibacillus athensensis TaxID=1967502 RepID=A0A4Y8Q274_9BACL